MLRVFFLFFIVIPMLIEAATCTAIADGNWSTGSTWDCGSKPGKADNVIINGFAVVLNQNLTGGSNKRQGNLTITGGGSLIGSYNIDFQAGHLTVDATSTLDVNNVVFANGADVQMDGTMNVNNLTNNNNNSNVIIDGNVDVSGNLNNGTGAVIDGSGYITMSGGGSITNNGTIEGLDDSGNIDLSGNQNLAVDFLNANTETLGENIKISWKVASANNNRGFIIKCYDVSMNFLDDYSVVSKAINSNLAIEYEHLIPKLGVRYIELLEEDLDGKITSLILMDVNNSLNFKSDIKAINKVFGISIINPKLEYVNYAIYNLDGSLVLKGSFFTSEIQIPYESLHNKIQIISFETCCSNHSQKIIVTQ